MIQNIEISKIFPHPDNPRKELGDLTELAESIKSNGIFQNLTVVPQLAMTPGYCTSCNLYNGAVGKCKSDYDKSEKPPCSRWVVRSDFVFTTIIGHRRLAAAKLAGLTEVPCSISNMSFRKQISTMLLENMQRSDLTMYEQAQGFQMMLDLGESINDISQSTGFSETTVRRRIKLTEFDKEKFRQSVERGGTLMDYAELDKINDVNLRNKVLDKIGTSDFKWELQRAIDTEKSEINKALLIAELEKFAVRVESDNGMQRIRTYYPSQDTEITAPDDTDTVEYFFQEQNYGAITLYKKTDDSNQGASSTKEPAWLEKQRERDSRRAALDEMSKRAYQLRCEFIKKISNSMAKKNIGVITEYLLRAALFNNGDVDLEDFAQFFGIEINEEDEESFDIIADSVTAQPERNLLAAAYLLNDSANARYYNWENQHQDDETLNAAYNFLEKLGYKVSEEETTLRNGTHKLFLSENEDK